MAVRNDCPCKHRVAHLILLLLGALAPILGGGCMSIDRGQFVQRNVLRRVPEKEVVKEVSSVDIACQIVEKDVKVRASYRGIADYGTAHLIEEVPYQKKLIVGLFPGFATRHAPFIEGFRKPDGSIDESFLFLGQLYGWVSPFWYTAMSVPSLMLSPFQDYRVADSWHPSEQALLGFYKVLKPLDTLSTKESYEIVNTVQEDLPIHRPLRNAQILCEIPALRFSDYIRTDATGIATTHLRSVPESGYYGIELTFVAGGGPDPEPSLFDDYRNGIQRSRVYIGAQKEGEMPLLLGGSGIPPASWSLESVAVAQLTANGTAATEAATLTEWLHAALVETGYFKLTSRDDIEKILKEQNFQRSDRCDDTECLIEMGQLCAVSKMIGGSVGVVGQSSVVTLRIIDVETGETTCAASGKTQGGEDVLALVRSVAEDLCRKYAKTRGAANE